MAGLGQCSVCLGEFEEPVCIPCGHVYCLSCITDVVNRPEERGSTARCPTCRSEFHLVVPDLTYLPSKYHPFVVSPLRRIYIDAPSPTPSTSSAATPRAREQEQERAALRQLEAEVARHKARVARHKENEEVLQQQCARHQAKAVGYRDKESRAQVEIRRLKKMCEDAMEHLQRTEYEKKLLEGMYQRRGKEEEDKVRELKIEVERLKKENQAMKKSTNHVSLSTPMKAILKASKKVRVHRHDSIDIDILSPSTSNPPSLKIKNTHQRVSSKDIFSSPSPSTDDAMPDLPIPFESSPEEAFSSGSPTERAMCPLPRRRISTNSLNPISPLLPIPPQPKRVKVPFVPGTPGGAGANSNLAYYKARANEAYRCGGKGELESEDTRWMHHHGAAERIR